MSKPAFFAPVDGKWIQQAHNEFQSGKSKIYFYTSSPSASKASELDIKKVYFKAKGESVVSARAEFIELTEINPRDFRLQGAENDTGRYYYGYKNLEILSQPIPLENLYRYPSKKQLRNDAPGCCIIEEPGDN